MRIIEQTRDRLLIEGRKELPDLRYGIAPGLLFTMPLFVAYWNARAEHGAWKLLVIIAAIWLIIAAIYAAVVRFSAPPAIDLDVTSGRAHIGAGDVPLDSIRSVSLDSGSLVFGLEDGDETMFVHRASTDAEKARAAKVIRAFLQTQKPPVSTADPYRELHVAEYVDATPEIEAEAEQVDHASDLERGVAERWATSWDAESTTNRKCYFCDKRSGDAAPVVLYGTHERLDLHERIYIPRCRRCSRIHDLHKRLVPAFVVLAAWVASFTFFMVNAAERLHTPLTLIGGFIVIALGGPVLAVVLARLITRPAFFGTKEVGAWQHYPAVEQGRRSGWTFGARWADRG